MYALDYAKRYVVYRIEEGDGRDGDDKVVVLGSYTKSYVAKAKAKNKGAEVLDTQEVKPEVLAYFNELTGSEFGKWVKVGNTAIYVEALKSLSERVRIMLEARYGLPVASVRSIIKSHFIGEVTECYCDPVSEADIVDGIVERITRDPASYLCIQPR